MALLEAFVEVLNKATIGEVMVVMCVFMGPPVWVGLFIGILIGWAWKPNWVSSSSAIATPQLPSSPAFVAVTQSTWSLPTQTTASVSDLESKENLTMRLSNAKMDEGLVVTEEDFKHLSHLVDRKDGGLPWRHMMDRSTDGMDYQAWMREPETGPPQYCSRTVYEDATPELLRDFFWDDEFRLKWDDMILHAETVEECPTTGTMIVHWIRKFPFFCSDREYIIGRRIWESGRSYYCVTKGVPYPSIAKRQIPRRVDLYYSSWCIKAVESSKGNGQLSACEVILLHHEDMGISWNIAKFGVKQGMWGAAKNVGRGFRAYQKERASKSSLSRSAFMAQINTKIDPEHLKSLESDVNVEKTEAVSRSEKQVSSSIPKLLVFGGAIALACSLDRGLLTKAVVFSVARRFGNIGKGAFAGT